MLSICQEKEPDLVELIPKLLKQFRKCAIGVILDVTEVFSADKPS